MNIEVGQGFKGYSSGRPIYGLIIGNTNNNIEFIRVVPVNFKDALNKTRHRYSYDEADAVYNRDKDNVRLESCPPPFSDFGTVVSRVHGDMSNSMALANMDRTYHISLDSFLTNKWEILDNGAKVSDFDMSRVFYHPFPRDTQMERRLKDIMEVSLDDDVHMMMKE